MTKKILNYFLDLLMFVVPLLEMTELIAVVPVEYLPFYMLGAVVLRRLVRILEDYQDAKSSTTTST
jgi:hypothetical protein